mmetsp:Transcript_88206/g.257827  ORF Transcript_88206/g.257827 Transcript_88206/m.257827 type:complete len:215 (+) Transcript_88206:1519-2163(+)
MVLVLVCLPRLTSLHCLRCGLAQLLQQRGRLLEGDLPGHLPLGALHGRDGALQGADGAAGVRLVASVDLVLRLPSRGLVGDFPLQAGDVCGEIANAGGQVGEVPLQLRGLSRERRQDGLRFLDVVDLLVGFILAEAGKLVILGGLLLAVLLHLCAQPLQKLNDLLHWRGARRGRLLRTTTHGLGSGQCQEEDQKACCTSQDHRSYNRVGELANT